MLNTPIVWCQICVNPLPWILVFKIGGMGFENFRSKKRGKTIWKYRTHWTWEYHCGILSYSIFNKPWDETKHSWMEEKTLFAAIGFWCGRESDSPLRWWVPAVVGGATLIRGKSRWTGSKQALSLEHIRDLLAMYYVYVIYVFKYS